MIRSAFAALGGLGTLFTTTAKGSHVQSSSAPPMSSVKTDVEKAGEEGKEPSPTKQEQEERVALESMTKSEPRKKRLTTGKDDEDEDEEDVVVRSGADEEEANTDGEKSEEEEEEEAASSSEEEDSEDSSSDAEEGEDDQDEEEEEEKKIKALISKKRQIKMHISVTLDAKLREEAIRVCGLADKTCGEDLETAIREIRTITAGKFTMDDALKYFLLYTAHMFPASSGPPFVLVREDNYVVQLMRRVPHEYNKTLYKHVRRTKAKRQHYVERHCLLLSLKIFAQYYFHAAQGAEIIRRYLLTSVIKMLKTSDDFVRMAENFVRDNVRERDLEGKNRDASSTDLFDGLCPMVREYQSAPLVLVPKTHVVSLFIESYLPFKQNEFCLEMTIIEKNVYFLMYLKNFCVAFMCWVAFRPETIPKPVTPQTVVFVPAAPLPLPTGSASGLPITAAAGVPLTLPTQRPAGLSPAQNSLHCDGGGSGSAVDDL